MKSDGVKFNLKNRSRCNFENISIFFKKSIEMGFSFFIQMKNLLLLKTRRFADGIDDRVGINENVTIQRMKM